jgi:D-alanyl-lipoteichoic acid acyltransferase DltB (MBOAT superfamily)
VQLRIDSLPFLGGALALVAVLRLLPRRVGLTVYALGSLAVWLATIARPDAILLGVAFLFLPLLVVRLRRNLPGWGKALLFGVQIAQLLWIRRYVDRIPFLSGLALPQGFVLLGVSYMLLKQIEWVLWVDSDDDEPLDALTYTGFVAGFFTLLAGPIHRYRDFRQGFASVPSDADALLGGLDRIVNGYLKASLIAPLLGDFTQPSWLAEHPHNLWAFAWFLAAYPLYVYFNFAGYCDVVIGLGRLCNFPIPENFAWPFAAPNIQEFWQRWHISFSSWIRVHVFFPLVRFTRMGARLPGPLAMGLSVVVTFLIVGAWHGPTPGFLIFGLLHALAALAVAPYGWLLERLLGEQGKAAYEASRPLKVVRAALCFSYLALSMLFFEREPAAVKALLAHVF